MPPAFTLVLATRNPGKLDELRAKLAALPVVLLAASDFPEAPDVEEDAPTLAGNARKKALALHQHTGLPALADDTGLEVDALGGRPGVHSARYAGPACDAAANRALLLNELAGHPVRTARFRTVLAFVEGGVVRLIDGVCEGAILTEEKGGGGFGYDRLFQPDGYAETFAEMSMDLKNQISHRGRALDAFARYLAARLAEGRR